MFTANETPFLKHTMLVMTGNCVVLKAAFLTQTTAPVRPLMANGTIGVEYFRGDNSWGPFARTLGCGIGLTASFATTVQNMFSARRALRTLAALTALRALAVLAGLADRRSRSVQCCNVMCYMML